MSRFKELCIVTMMLFSLFALTAVTPPANAEEFADRRIQELLLVNPGLSEGELRQTLQERASELGIQYDQMLERAHEDAREALAVHLPEALPEGGQSGQTRQAPSLTLNSSGGSTDDGYAVTLGCGYQGFYTYSFARNAGVNHGHNVLFVKACQAIHAPGPGRSLERIYRPYGLWHKNEYPAHVRRVTGASYNMLDRAAAFAENRLAAGAGCNSNFALNKEVWASNFNCSQLVWAAWMYASTNNVDLDSNGGFGVYPEDLWKSPLTVINRYLERA